MGNRERDHQPSPDSSPVNWSRIRGEGRDLTNALRRATQGPGPLAEMEETLLDVQEAHEQPVRMPRTQQPGRTRRNQERF